MLLFSRMTHPITCAPTHNIQLCWCQTCLSNLISSILQQQNWTAVSTWPSLVYGFIFSATNKWHVWRKGNDNNWKCERVLLNHPQAAYECCLSGGRTYGQLYFLDFSVIAFQTANLLPISNRSRWLFSSSFRNERFAIVHHPRQDELWAQKKTLSKWPRKHPLQLCLPAQWRRFKWS